MRLIEWFKGIFKKKKDPPSEIDFLKMIVLIKNILDNHSSVLASLKEKTNQGDEFRSLVSNGFTNLDNRIDALEKMAGYLYDKSTDQEDRLVTVEETTTSNEFSKLAKSLNTEDN